MTSNAAHPAVTRSCRCSPVGGHHRRPGGRRRQSGYVLLLTLLILALAGTVTAGVCRASFARAARSVRAEQDLQRRWGAASCSRAYLPRAERVIAAAEAAQRRALPAVRARVVLNGQAFDLWFADETAKLNANLLVHRRGKAEAEAVIKELVRAAGSDVRPRLLAGKPQAVRPRKPANRDADEASADPANDDSGGPTSRPGRRSAGRTGAAGTAEPQEEAEEEIEARPLQSFGQLFPGAAPAALAGTDGLSPAAALVSCWGDGRLNYRRAPDAVLKQFGPPTLTPGETTRLLRLRQQSPAAAAGSVLDQMKGLDEDARDTIEDRLAVESNCHSLWVVVRTPERAWHYFAVDDRSGERPGTMSFAW